MGKVYRAVDERLDREVAIKVLNRRLADDVGVMARLQREARLLASVNHPNIAGIYALEQDGNVQFLVLELAGGETLSDRLRRGALPEKLTLQIALQIARALEAAHEQGIIHRDLKPGNIKIDSRNEVKVLDFGLAKLDLSMPQASDLTANPTLAEEDQLTQAGMMLGTLGYMSPEQTRAADVGAQSDVWAFGCVVYEMLTGHRAFGGQAAADIIASILGREPEWELLPPDTTLRTLRLLRRCLEKDQRNRLHSISDVRIELEELVDSSSGGAAELEGGEGSGTAASRPISRLAWAAAGGLIIGVLALTSRYLPDEGAAPLPPAPVSVEKLTGQPGIETAPALAPDGKTIFYVGDAAGNPDIYVQRVGGHIPTNLTADSAADDTAPAISPDGNRVVFRSERDGGGLFIMGATGESVRQITDVGFDPDWSPDGERVVFAAEGIHDPLIRGSTTSKLFVVELATGEQREIYEVDGVQPNWSPGGHRVAVWQNRGGQRDILTVAATGGDPVLVTDDPWVDWSPIWAPDGRHLYFSSDRGGTMNLWRVPIDELTGRVLAPPEPMTAPTLWAGHPTISRDGTTMAYSVRDRRSTISVATFDPTREAVLGEPIPIVRGSLEIYGMHLSPDGEWIAFTTAGTREDVYVVGVDGSDFRQITDDLFRDRAVQWAPDGSLLAFYSNRSGKYQIWTIRPDGRELTQITDVPSVVFNPKWSPDGTELAIGGLSGGRILDLSRAPAADAITPLESMPGPLVFQPRAYSPDGRWIAGSGTSREGGAAHDGVFRYSLETKTYEELAAYGGLPIWLADSRRMLILLERSVALFDTESRTSTTLMHDVFDKTSPYQPPFSLSADNRRLALLRTVESEDLWLMKLESPTD